MPDANCYARFLQTSKKAGTLMTEVRAGPMAGKCCHIRLHACCIAPTETLDAPAIGHGVYLRSSSPHALPGGLRSRKHVGYVAMYPHSSSS